MRNQDLNQGGRTTVSISPATALLVVALALFAGFAGGRAFVGNTVRATVAEPDATATRTAELEELHRLQTAVAQPVMCTPAPSPTPTETPLPTATPTPVPPAPMGQAMSYAGDWTVVVSGFTAAPPPETADPSTKLLQVIVTVTNNLGEPRAFPFREWVLVDAGGRTFAVAESATTTLHGPGWYLNITPSLPQDFAIVFEVTADAGTSFVLESTTDPTFRVAVQLQVLG